MSRRVVITGMGIVSPLGQTVEETWTNILAGRSGIGPLQRFDTSNYAVKIAAEVKAWDPTTHIPAKEARRMDAYQQYALVAAGQALASSGMIIDDETCHRTGIIVGSSVGGVGSFDQQSHLLAHTGDPRKVTPFGIPMLMVNGASDLIAIQVGATGPTSVPISACATGGDCIGYAFDLIRMGRIDQALAGCGEAPITPTGLAAFDRTGACSRDNDRPEHASRPFAKDRAGLVFSEGAGVLALETLDRAQARGAHIYGELVGYGSTSDGYHITAPHPEGAGAVAAMRHALDDAGADVSDIDYINAHGTATHLNDLIETKAVKKLFGEHAYNIPMSSTKSMTGHAMGATAAFEAIFSLLALRDQVAPPTTNLTEPDPECDLDYVPHQPRELRIQRVMSNSFGFGGHNVSLVFQSYNGH